jgi:hypothetical protein
MRIITVLQSRWLAVSAAIVVIVLVIVIINCYNVARKESAAQRYIEGAGGVVSFRSSGPSWLRDLLSESNLGTVETVVFGPRTQDDDLSIFREHFKDVKSVMLNGTRIKGPGLIYLRNLPRIDSIDLTKSEITDEGLKHLGDLGRVTRVSLAFTSVTDQGVAELGRLKHLCDLSLEGTRVTDQTISCLSSLPLEQLNVIRTAVTSDGLDLLRSKNKRVHIYGGTASGSTNLVTQPAGPSGGLRVK